MSLAAPMINQGRFSLFAQSNATYSARTIDLVRRSTVIDMLGLITLNYRKFSTWGTDPERFGHADFLRLKNSGITALHPTRPSQFLRIEGSSDFERAKAVGKIGIVIGQQNSEHFRTVQDVDRFYALGQRVSQLTYRGNRIGGGSSDSRDIGLTKYGAAIVERMNRAGMAIDISHCADRTSLEAIEASRRPVLVTHSNCRSLVPYSSRCKTDEAIRRMALRGGVMGVTMVRAFVSAGATATIETVLDHIDHIAKLVGVEHAGVGSDVDLDGRDLPTHSPRKYDLDGIDYARKIYDLAEGLVQRKYSNQSIELILGGNFKRALSQAWIS